MREMYFSLKIITKEILKRWTSNKELRNQYECTISNQYKHIYNCITPEEKSPAEMMDESDLITYARDYN
jgi:hypothetical protein